MARKVYDPNEDALSSSPNQPTNGNAHEASQLETQSRELYTNFLREQISLHGLAVPDGVPMLSEGASFSNPLWLCTASNLRQLATDFACSPLREQVRQRAHQVDVATLNSETFSALIQELFQGGQVTRERVLVVFFFCSDLALLALHRHTLSIFRNLTQWSTEYIAGRMTSWIQDQGGWAAVLNQSVNTLLKISATAACIVAIFAMIIFIRKNCP